MHSGFVKLHRQVKHHWVASRPDWFQGWTFILMSANYETGQVNLTETYRELSHLFNNRAWRHFVSKLEQDGMLDSVETKNLGFTAGFQQIAIITNWSKYHGYAEKDMSHSLDEVAHKSRGALRGASVGASAELSAEQNVVQDVEKDIPARSLMSAERGASAELSAESNKNSIKEVKELKKEPPLTPPKSKKAKPLAHDFDPETVDLPDNFDRERFIDFCAMRLQKKDPMSALALKNFVRVNQDYSAPVLNRMFDNAIVPGWKALYPLKPWEQEEAERTPVVKSENERPPIGSMVEHPNWGANTIRYYTQSGQMVLDECGALAWPHEVTACPN